MAQYLYDSREASDRFGLNTSIWRRTPRPKFLFYVRFVRGYPTAIGSRQQDELLPLQVKYLDQPKITPVVETLHQYNKRRIVKTGVEYQPLTIRFWNTVDDTVLRMWSEYYEFYYGDGRRTRDGNKREWEDWNNDITSRLSEESWGFSPPSYSPQEGYFFSHLEIYQLYGQQYTQVNLVHPKIETFDHDSNDYSVGTEGQEITMSIRFEGVTYETLSGNIFDNPYLSELFRGQNINPLSNRTGGQGSSTIANAIFNNVSNFFIDTLNRNISTGEPLSQILSTVAGGSSLAKFGNFDFGPNINSIANSLITNLFNGYRGATPYPGHVDAFLADRISGNLQNIVESYIGDSVGSDTLGKAISGAVASYIQNPGDIGGAIERSVINVARKTPSGRLYLDRNAIGAVNAYRPRQSQQGVREITNLPWRNDGARQVDGLPWRNSGSNSNQRNIDALAGGVNI